MKHDRLRDLARRLSLRARLLLAAVGLLVGAGLIVVPHFALPETSPWLSVLTHLGSAVVAAAFVAVGTQFALTGELERLDWVDPLREDAEGLGIVRLMADLREVQAQVPLHEALREASLVYILGTTVTNTTGRMYGLMSANPHTEFRLLHASLPEGVRGETLEHVLHIIHDQPVRLKIGVANEELARLAAPNIKAKQLACVPTFSAILAEWRDGRCWLQVDHYLMRTKCDHRLWVTLDSRKGRSDLLTRYRKIINDMWDHPERYDVTELAHKPAMKLAAGP